MCEIDFFGITSLQSNQPSQFSSVQSVSQSVISRSRPALTPPPARSPAPPLPVEHKYRVLAPGGYSIVASSVQFSSVQISQVKSLQSKQMLACLLHFKASGARRIAAPTKVRRAGVHQSPRSLASQRRPARFRLSSRSTLPPFALSPLTHIPSTRAVLAAPLSVTRDTRLREGTARRRAPHRTTSLTQQVKSTQGI